jgi:tetratricopeptide (TPR) repeat protein
VRSEFWQVHSDESRADYMQVLKTYTVELSRLVHSEAQASGEKSKYLAAADYYGQFVEAFPDDPAVAENLFLLGEVYTEAKPGDASRINASCGVSTYARQRAGYAAVLGLTDVLNAAPASERELWQRVRIDAQIEFAMTFPTMRRQRLRPTRQMRCSRSASTTSDGAGPHLINTRPGLEPRLARTARLILGHGHFELGDYAGAEHDYRALLALPDTGESNAEVEQKLLAAIYKQAEEAEAAGAVDAAVTHYLRIADDAPGSELAATGHFDAIAVIEGGWAEPADLLAKFRARYPAARSASAGKRLADLYEKSELGGGRGNSGIAAADGDAEVRRRALTARRALSPDRRAPR